MTNLYYTYLKKLARKKFLSFPWLRYISLMTRRLVLLILLQFFFLLLLCWYITIIYQIIRFIETKPVRGLIWAKEYKTLKWAPMCGKAGIPLIHFGKSSPQRSHSAAGSAAQPWHWRPRCSCLAGLCNWHARWHLTVLLCSSSLNVSLLLHSLWSIARPRDHLRQANS
jgi:hypothetical protein